MEIGLVLKQLGTTRRQVPDLLSDQTQPPPYPRRLPATQVQPRSLPDVVESLQFPPDLEVRGHLTPFFLDVLAEERDRPVHGQITQLMRGVVQSLS
jgi:hypothetical protein